MTTFKVKIVDFGADGAYQGEMIKSLKSHVLSLKRMEQLKFRYEFTGLTTKAYCTIRFLRFCWNNLHR
jgi:hypothetical protein